MIAADYARVGRAELLTRVRERLADSGAVPTPEIIAEAVRAESGGVLGDTDLLSALKFLQTELMGAGRLESLLAEPTVADVLVTGAQRAGEGGLGKVWVDRGRGLELSDITFPDEDSVRRLAVRLALKAGKRLDDAQPWVDGQLTGLIRTGLAIRLHAVIPPIAVDGTSISLRILRPVTMSFDVLIASGALAADAAELLRKIISARLAFLIIGGTGAGKTTLLSALLSMVDSKERIICVEDAIELCPQHPQIIRLAARTPNVENVGAVSVRELVRQSLRMRPDRLVVGEVRGSEIVDLLTALNTGHDGGAGTLHANSALEVLARMEALAALGGMDRTTLHSQVAAALQVVLTVSRIPTGQRQLTEIAMFRREKNSLVSVVPIWRLSDGFTSAATDFADLIASRRG